HKRYHDSVMNRVALLMTSRGCPFRCNFCACWKLMDGKYAARTAESIIVELKSMPERMNVVYFSDDNTFHDIGRMWKLNSLIRENGIRKKFQMYARADTIIKHQDLFRELTGSGLQFLTVGLESIRREDLDYYNKKTSVEINNQAIMILKKLNIHIMAHFIIRPEYGKEDFAELYRYVSRNNLFRPAYPVLTPLPGTDLFEEKYNEFQTRNYDYFDFVHSILPTKLSKKEFYRQLSGIYVKSYSPLRVVAHRLNRFLSINKARYFTSNIDGASFIRFVLIYLAGTANFLKLRYYYVFKKGI
ncbi:MAG: B12-binding domain-containing radical SAM protein, partial [Chloroflexota bacterium]